MTPETKATKSFPEAPAGLSYKFPGIARFVAQSLESLRANQAAAALPLLASSEYRQTGGSVKRSSLIALLILFLVPVASAQDWASQRVEKSPRHREWVTVKHDGRSVETFVVFPESKDKRPVVLVIHEIFGMTDWVQELADEVAEAGYIAVAPDLLSDMAPNGGRSKDFPQNAATEAVGKLNPEQITADLNAAAEYGLRLPASNGKLFVGGFCWGGAQTFRFATNRSDLAAAFVFYGSPPEKEAMARIKAPVYGFYAGNDARIGATIPDAIANMKAAGKTYDPVTYDGAGHGFMRAGEAPDASDANKKARADAWARWKSLLK
jgi:carboxymethylenebutenolidase